MAGRSRSIQIPPEFVRTQREVNGEAGLAWLSRLPELIAECEREWSLVVGPPLLPLSYNYVAPAVRAGGTAAILKACYPSRELYSEAAALRL